MLAIKLQRIGKKHQPSYRVVVALKKSKMAAPPVEDLGSYNPFTKTTTVKKDRVSYWMGKGAQPTVTTHNMLVKEGIISLPKKAVKMPKPVAKAAPAEPEQASSEQEAAAPTEEKAEASAEAAPAEGAA